MIHNREFETVDIYCDVAITWTMFMHNFNFSWNMECMVLNQTLKVRRKEKQNNLGEQKKVKLYVNYFSSCSTFISLHSPSNSHFFKSMWRDNYNYASQIAPALINVKLISKSLTEGLVYRVAARLSIARVFSVWICTPWEGRLLLMKSLAAFLNSELGKLYKMGLMAELR